MLIFYTRKKENKNQQGRGEKIQNRNQTQMNPTICQINKISVLKDGGKVTQMTFEHSTLHTVST